jgi:predicted DNA-binding protein (MmcQ/YjbR family)
MKMTPVPPEMKRLEPFELALRDAGLVYPEATEDFPWGHRTLKVKGKAFIFMALSAEGLSMSFKLPQSNGAALMMPFAQPTGYGMGKSGWVTASFGARDTPPVEMLRKWLDESYRAVAPKKLVAQLDGAAPKAEARTKAAQGRKAAPAAKKTAAKKTAAKKTSASSRTRRT